MEYSVFMNDEKNGIEIRFGIKPSSEIISELKENGFRWSGKQEMWYAKQSPERIIIANNIDGIRNDSIPKAKSKPEYDMWDLTRTNNIPNFYEEQREYDKKVIAANIRKHIKSRFPMCKFSVRMGGYKSIYVDMLESPFDKDSDIIKAICHYIYMYAESWNYDNSDAMSDYFDRNFYGIYEHQIVSYNYKQREMTASEFNIEEKFEKKRKAYEEAEAIRQEQEYAKQCVEMKKREEEAKAANEQAKKDAEFIINSISIFDVKEDKQYFVTNLIECSSKLSSIKEYENAMNDDECVCRRNNCKVSREIVMPTEAYEKFSKMLLHDFEFLKGKGGTSTDDVRINAMSDYISMSQSEKDTVEWYMDDCIAIYDNDKTLKMVIDPEGYSYARYVLFPDVKTTITHDYKPAKGMEDESISEYESKASEVEKYIVEMMDSWGINKEEIVLDGDEYKLFRCNTTKFIKDNGYTNELKNIIPFIKDNNIRMAMNKVATVPDKLAVQFVRAAFEEDEPITIISNTSFGCEPAINHCKFKRFEPKKYAQYDDAVKVIFRPERKRSDYYIHIHNGEDRIICKGKIDLPRELFYEKVDSSNPGWKMEKSKFASFDKQIMEVARQYLNDNNIEILVDTKNPII